MSGKKNILLGKNWRWKSKKKSLSKIGHTSLSEKENELFNKTLIFGFKNIDKLVQTFNNAETEVKYIELLNYVRNWTNILQKLVKTVSNPVEKERIKNILEAVDKVLDYFLSIVSIESDFNSDTEGKGFKILTLKQMLCRLPISLAQ